MERADDDDAPVVIFPGYNEPDVDWYALDEATLLKIENGEEDVNGLIIEEGCLIADVNGDDDNDARFILAPWADAERIGDAIANSTNLLKLSICHFNDEFRVFLSLIDLFHGIARNRFIEHLDIWGVHRDRFLLESPFEIISPFFEHNHNLCSIILHSFDLTAYFDSFLRALSLCDKDQFKRISLIDNGLVDKQIAKFVNALQDHHNLLMLDISSNEISHNGFLALSKLLHQPWSKIHSLIVNQSDFIGDKCITLLSAAMVVNKTIKILEVDGRNVTSNGWSTLSCVICSLERLTLRRDLDDESITAIGDSLVTNKVLNYLDLCGNRQITEAGWDCFSSCLRNPTCTLQHLSVSACGEVNGIAGAIGFNTSLEIMDVSYCSITNAGAIEIADALAVNSSLKSLTMDRNDSVTAAGWVEFFNRLSDSACSLEELDLSSNSMNDEGAAALVDLLAGMITLKCLKLTDCNFITTNGWRLIAGLLQTNSNVMSLELGGEFIDDTEVIPFAVALKTNKCLRYLSLTGGEEITNKAWDAFTNIFCDNSFVQSTYHSNHTLHTLQIVYNQWNQFQVPAHIANVLELNATNQDKVALARQKIIANHFSASKIDTQAFSGMTVPVLPHALEWIGRDILGFSLLYQVSRVILVPKLFE
jgi:hypothetical protein